MSSWINRYLTELKALYQVHRRLPVLPPPPIPRSAPATWRGQRVSVIELVLMAALVLSVIALLIVVSCIPDDLFSAG